MAQVNTNYQARKTAAETLKGNDMNTAINYKARKTAAESLARLQSLENARKEALYAAIQAEREAVEEARYLARHQQVIEAAIASACFDVVYVEEDDYGTLLRSSALYSTHAKGGIYGYHVEIRQWVGQPPEYWVGVSAPAHSGGYWSESFPLTADGFKECMDVWESVCERCERSWK